MSTARLNWLGIAFRLTYASLAALALVGWMFFGWQQALGVMIGFLLAALTLAATEMRKQGIDPFALRKGE